MTREWPFASTEELLESQWQTFPNSPDMYITAMWARVIGVGFLFFTLVPEILARYKHV